jgi:hypothetical protein
LHTGAPVRRSQTIVVPLVGNADRCDVNAIHPPRERFVRAVEL